MQTKRRTLQRGITVDGPKSRDLDDAIYWEKRGTQWYVEVSISDVGAQTALLSPYDAEAYTQAYTLYFRSGNRPMWPRSYSDDQLSLLPNQPRLTLTKKITLDQDLNVIEFEIEPTILVSQARMTYEQVDAILNDNEHQFHQQWTDGVELALRLLNQRREKGALALFDLHDGYMTTEEGEVIHIPQGRFYRAYILVQEFMILANRVTTETLKNAGWYFLFRNHQADPELNRDYLTKAVTALDLEPTVELIQQLISVTNSLMGRAKYSPYCESHFGLNLDAYAHWTSPIRRYVDVINQRILHAWLDGKQNPYTLQELERIAQHLNQRMNEIRDHNNDYFRQQRTRILANCTAEQILELEPGFFSAMVKRLIDGTFELTPERANGIIQRIQADSIRLANIGCLLLYTAGKSEHWMMVKQTAFDWLTEHPELGPQVWIAARSILDLPPYERIHLHRESARGRFCYQASVEIYQMSFKGESTVAHQKRQAERLAFLSLIATIASISYKVPQEVAPMSIITENPKSKLFELCQKHGWAFPEFNITQTGPSHDPTFSGTATLTISSDTYVSDEVSASQRKEAERLMSQSLFEKIPSDFFESNSGPSVETTVTRNPIGALQEWCQGNGYPMPVYAFEQSGADHAPIFKATCTITIDGEPQSWEGLYSAKKEAKKLAAAEACQALLPH